MIGKALEIAWKAHEGQTDKAGKPYIQHPLAVASRMETEEEIAIALLHDVVEDTEVTFEDLEQAGFPQRVLEALRLLTHDPAEDYFTYIERVKGNPLARKVKLADLAHNSQTDRLPEITEKDRERLEKYRKAKEILGERQSQ